MASKRKKGAKEKQGIMTDGRVWVEKRVLVNLGDYSSYAIMYGLEDAVIEGETARDAMYRLKEQIEDQVNKDLDEIENVVKKIPRPKKDLKKKRRK